MNEFVLALFEKTAQGMRNGRARRDTNGQFALFLGGRSEVTGVFTDFTVYPGV